MNLVKFKPKKILLFIGLMGWFSIPFFFPIVEFYGNNYFHYGLIIFFIPGSYLMFSLFTMIPIFFVSTAFILIFKIRSWLIKVLLILLTSISFLFILFYISNYGLILFGMYALAFNLILAYVLLVHSMLIKRS